MPIHIDIMLREKLVVIVARGEVTADAIEQSTKTLGAASIPGFAKVVDIAGSTSILTHEQVRGIAALLCGCAHSTTRSVVAFVVNSGQKEFAEAFAEVTHGERPIALFESLHAVRDRLSVAQTGGPRSSVALHDGVRV